jgi:hypothetical protein
MRRGSRDAIVAVFGRWDDEPRVRNVYHVVAGQEGGVFVVATSNDVSQLPPELMRTDDSMNFSS